LLEGVRGDAEALGDIEVIARVYALLLRIRTMAEENYSIPEYRDLMDRAYAVAPQVSAPDLRAYLEGMMGQVLRSGDEYAASLELVAGSVDPLETAGRVGEAGLNAAYAADVEASRGRFEEADRWIARASALGEASGNPGVVADVALVEGRIAAGRGELEAALAHTRRGIETAAGSSNIQCELVGNFLVADQQLRSGDADSAISHLERTFELGEFCNAVAIVKLGEAWLTSARASLGDLDPEGFAGPLAMAQAGGSRSGEAAVRVQRAIAISASSNPDWASAFDDFERAIELLGSIDARPDQARAIHAHANALDAAGRDQDSRAQLDAAMAMFDEMGIRPDTASV
jgi:tetratricopeptide (TPR) repeat protein